MADASPNVLGEPAFPAGAWFRHLAAFLENDADFRQHGRWLTARIALRVDRDIVVLQFDRGLVLDVAEGFAEHDLLIAGTAADWDHLFVKGWGLVRLYRSGTLQLRGDAVWIMRNWKALFFITDAMRRLGAAPAPAARAGAAHALS
jgi:hypothetical protein